MLRNAVIALLLALAAGCGAHRPAKAPVVVGSSLPPTDVLGSLASHLEDWGWRVHPAACSPWRLVADGGYELRGDVVAREVWTFTSLGHAVTVERRLETRDDDGRWHADETCESCDAQREDEIAGRVAEALSRRY